MKNPSRGFWILLAAFVATVAVYLYVQERTIEAVEQTVEIAAPLDKERSALGTVNGFTLSIKEPELRSFMEQFYVALHGDNFEFVSVQFAEDAIIFENGTREPSLAAYLEKHLKPEMTVIKSARRQILDQESALAGDRALVTTSSTLSFSIEGKRLDFYSVETLGLVKRNGRWLIQHAHWSSRPIEN